MAYGELSLRDAGSQLLMSMLEFLATVVRLLHEYVQSSAETQGGSAGRADAVEGEASSLPETVPVVAEVALEEGEVGNERYANELLRERLRALAVQKPKRYYAVARGRAPGIYLSWPETEPLVSRFRGSKFESFATREEAESWLMREIHEGV